MQQTSTRREQIAANARAAKARRQATDADIAEAIGLSRSAVTDRMLGRTRWQVEELEAAARFLATSLDELLA